MVKRLPMLGGVPPIDNERRLILSVGAHLLSQ